MDFKALGELLQSGGALALLAVVLWWVGKFAAMYLEQTKTFTRKDTNGYANGLSSAMAEARQTWARHDLSHVSTASAMAAVSEKLDSMDRHLEAIELLQQKLLEHFSRVK